MSVWGVDEVAGFFGVHLFEGVFGGDVLIYDSQSVHFIVLCLDSVEKVR